MRLNSITALISEMIGKQYSPVIDVAIHAFETDMAVKLTNSQISHLANKAQLLYDKYRTAVFEGEDNPYTIQERQEIMKLFFHGEDISLYISLLEDAC